MQDKNDKQYVAIMVDSLKQKKEVLDQIISETEFQMNLLKEDEVDFEAYDEKVDKKTELIRELDRLDEGFDSLYNKVKDILQTDEGKDAYRNEILSMQQLITSITERSTSIQAMEARNKSLLETGIANARRKLNGNRTTSRAAMDYYKNMRQTNVITPQFLDSKK